MASVNPQGPLQMLSKSMRGGLGQGNLGVVMARAGVGKTACLVQISLHELLRARRVLHVALRHTIEHVQSWYDLLFEDLTDPSSREAAHALVTSHRMITAFGDHDLWLDRLRETVDTLAANVGFKPQVLVVDGYDWAARDVAETRAAVEQFKAYAKSIGAEIWMSAQTHREHTGTHPAEIPPPCAACAEAIDVALFLEPHGASVALWMLKNHDEVGPADTHVHLHPDTLRLISEGDRQRPSVRLPPGAYTLLSGGAKGAEAEFGACAEQWGLREQTFSFAGRTPQRTRGLVQLTAEQLEQGAVSQVYLKAHMHRTYPATAALRDVLRSIWHQVNTAGEVFSIGQILEDKTVKGGTGWATELGRLWNKKVHVYDQERRGWYRWRDDQWQPEVDPVITCRRFTGTGTRLLSDGGRDAIRELFARSFA